jgi:hypothetical protein
MPAAIHMVGALLSSSDAVGAVVGWAGLSAGLEGWEGGDLVSS